MSADPAPASFEVSVHCDAPVERVWELVSNHVGYRRFTPLRVAELEQQGEPDPNGVGAIRRLGMPGYVVREQVVAYDAPRSFSYTILSGIPVRGYLAQVTLTPLATGGTRIDWTGRFDSAPPGMRRAMRQFLRTIVADTAKRVAKYAASNS